MSREVREIVVFMASPSDLSAERELIRRLGDEINATFAPHGLAVRIVGWETVAPELGRPQEHINPHVHECDVFVGILKRRWGSPTGQYSSGFEEEFQIAVQRREGSHTPSVALYFMKVSSEDLEDPGRHLRKVMAFKKRIQTQHIGMYSEFTSADDLLRQVQTRLTEHLLRLMASPPSETDASTRPERATPAVPEGPTDEMDNARRQLSRVLQDLDRIIRGESEDIEFDRDRISLIGMAFGHDQDVLGSHLVNRLYQRRADLSLSVGETDSWARTLLDDIGGRSDPSSRTIPGWGANILGYKSTEALAELVNWATNSDETVARGAVRTLRRLRLVRRTAAESLNHDTEHLDGPRPDTDGSDRTTVAYGITPQQWVEILNASPGRSAALDLLISVELPSRVVIDSVLEAEALNESSREVLQALQEGLDGDYSMLARHAPSSAGQDGSALHALLLENTRLIHAEGLNRLATNNYTAMELRLAAIKEGLARKSLTSKSLHELLKQENHDVNEVLASAAASDSTLATALLDIITKEKLHLFGSPNLRPRLLAVAHSADELQALHESDPFDVAPWEALTHIRGPAMLDDARQIIDDDAEVFRRRLAEYVDSHEILVTHVVSHAVRAAADLISRSPNRSQLDDERVLKAFSSSDRIVKAAELSLLDRIYNEETATRITAALDRAEDNLLLSELPRFMDSRMAPAVAAHLAESEISAFRILSREWFLQRADAPREVLMEALYDEEGSIRITALRSLMEREDKSSLETLITQYPLQGRQYWYNVVAALDEHLYASPPAT